VTVDCASLSPNLVASELFGHERGAFTGADRQHKGAFERADGGTLFLDEIGELPPELTPNLLGALERRRFRRVGGRDEIEVDVRVVAATHRDLRAEVNDGRFRLDLHYRLAAVRLAIPPLRDQPRQASQRGGDRVCSRAHARASRALEREAHWTEGGARVASGSNSVPIARRQGQSPVESERGRERSAPGARSPCRQSASCSSRGVGGMR